MSDSMLVSKMTEEFARETDADKAEELKQRIIEVKELHHDTT